MDNHVIANGTEWSEAIPNPCDCFPSLAMTTIISNSINDRPNSINDRPNSINDRPNSISDRPNSINDRPNSINDRPNSINDCPNSINDCPNSINNRPQYGSVKARDARESPSLQRTYYCKDGDSLASL
jgi:hypothetical protein